MNRRQRMTDDVLGRTVKIEGLNTDQQQGVYVTRTDTYNARDQVTGIFVQGTSGAGQQTLMTYDGHGRLATRKLPIELSGAPGTIYLYNADDTVQKVTDPRGASSTYTYNARHLVRTITYAKPDVSSPSEINAIPDVPPVGFDYDAAGSRAWMTDGLGRVDYVYDTWSRLTSETRTFNDFPGSTYPLTYDYNLAGQLKLVTDTSGIAINYAYDQAGQLTGVTGSNFAGVTQYTSSLQYRAWGALKHMATGDGKTTDFSYNGRLQVTSFVREPNTFGHSNYQYHADGRVSFVQNLDNPTFDRKYSYDHMARLSEGLSGTDARGEPYDPKNPPPYKQTYSYSVFNHMTARSNRFWTQDQGTFTASYSNDRNTAWDYDDAGNLKNNSYGTYKWDTAGRMKEFSRINTVMITQLYDGDGFPAYRAEARSGLTDRAIIYYVRSSVLGGQTVTELKPNGAKRRTYVYASGGEIARQERMTPDHVTWISRDPITGDDDITRDPLGGYLGNENDVLFPDYESLKGNSPTHERDADPFSSGMGCTVDGVSIDCDVFASMVNNGAVLLQGFGGGGTKDPVWNISHNGIGGAGIGGAWVTEWTPSQPTWDPKNLNLNVTDNAYRDVWRSFSGLFGSGASSAGLGQSTGRGFLIGRFGFSDKEGAKLGGAYERVTRGDCGQFFDATVAEAIHNKLIPGNDGRPKTLGGLLQITTLNRYDSNLRANDVVLPRSYWADVQAHFDNGDIAFTSRYDGRIFLGDNAFHESSFFSRHFMGDEDVDLPGNITHEFFHRVGFKHGPNFPKERDIQKNCGEPGNYIGPSNPSRK